MNSEEECWPLPEPATEAADRHRPLSQQAGFGRADLGPIQDEQDGGTGVGASRHPEPPASPLGEGDVGVIGRDLSGTSSAFRSNGCFKHLTGLNEMMF